MESAVEVRLGSAPEQSPALPALAVDVDGTLVKTDLLLESLVALLKQRPWCIFALPIWLARSVAYFKQEVARRVSLDVSVLPYRQDLVDYLRTQRTRGRMLVLATAGDSQLAHEVADHLKLFDLVLASDGSTNLSGDEKRDRLVKEFGEKGFDYAGNGRHDLTVWSAARKAIVVNPGQWVRSRAATAAQLDRVFEDARKSVTVYLKALRPQHLLKNVLVFVPLLAAHRLNEGALLGRLILAFLAFGCIASSGYLVNDLLDLPADRRHPTKRFRPFAAGDVPLSYALTMIPLLLGLGLVIGRLVSGVFVGMLLGYLALSMTYSLLFKQIVVLDVIILASLYGVRILAGSAAVSIWPSHWLLAFSTFLFFSLALVKRYGELAVMRRVEGDRAKARGYETSDGELLAAMGVASGYLAVLVLALYINSDTAQTLYGRYQLKWFLCPLLLYWITYAWLIAHRGKMPDDPVLFTMNDWTSRVLIALMAAVVVIAL